MSLLRDILVVEIGDATTAVAGRLLSELGAEVVIVEPPGGSAERFRPPFVDDRPGPESSLRWWANAGGKRSVVIDLDHADGVANLASLVSRADVVLEGVGGGLRDRGITAADLGAGSDQLIWVSVTPFGSDSERADDPFTDLTLLAGNGPVWNCGYDDRTIPPMRGAGEQAFNIAGHYAAIGALVAVVGRDHSGRGQFVEVDIHAACNVTSEQVTYNWLLIQQVCRRQTGRHAYYVPTGEVQVRCADGAYATTGVLPRMPAQFADLHAWLVELDLLESVPEAFFLEMAAARDEPVNEAAAGENPEISAMLETARETIRCIAAALPAKDFFLQSQRRGFPVGAVLSPDEAFEDEHVASRGFKVPVAHPELGRTIDHAGVPYRFSSTAATAPRKAPALGEHTDEVLTGRRSRSR